MLKYTLRNTLRRMIVVMSKRVKSKGRSMRNGNAPSPYTKYAKTPYKYSSQYHNWRQDRLAGRKTKDTTSDSPSFKYAEAAE